MTMNSRARVGLRTAILVLLVASLVYGCATFTRDSCRTLSIAATTYDTAMKSIADLYRQGKVTEEQKIKVLEIATEYWAAYHIATDALEAYMTVSSVDNEKRLEIAMMEFSKVLSKFMNYVQPIIAKGGEL